MTSSAPPTLPPLAASAAQQLGISAGEWKQILQDLGRPPNELEGGVIAHLWSDECSKKNLRVFLRSVFREGPNVVPLPSRRVGAVEIGFGEAVVVTIGEQNLDLSTAPSAAPQLLSTALLGDLASVGAEQLAVLGLSRFGDAENTLTQEGLQSALSGLATFGNTVGVGIPAYDIFFHERFDGRPVINAAAVGIINVESLRHSREPSAGDAVLLLGPRRHQGGSSGADPYLAAVIQALLPAWIREGEVVDAQVVGTGGVLSACFDIARRLGVGVRVAGDQLRPQGSDAKTLDILRTPASGQLLIVVKHAHLRDVRERFSAAGIHATEAGELLSTSDLEIVSQHQLLAALPLKLLAGVLDEKSYQLLRFPPMPKKKRPKSEESEEPQRPAKRVPLDDAWLDLLADPNLCSRAPLLRRFDTGLGLHVLPNHAGSAAVLRLKTGAAPNERAVCAVLHSSTLYSTQDPYLAGVHTVAEAMRKLAASGASALAAAQCLNFGNPKEHRQMSDFAETLRGMSDACRFWELPILSDQLSFSRLPGATFALPVAAVCLVGVLTRTENARQHYLGERGDVLLLLGETRNEFQASEYLSYRGVALGRGVPEIDFPREKAICDLIVELIQERLLASALSLGRGGLAAALADACLTRPRALGAALTIASSSLSAEAVLFSESAGRFLVSCSPDKRSEVIARCQHFGISIGGEGVVGGKEIVLEYDRRYALPLSTAQQIYNTGLDHILEHDLQAA